MSRNSRGSHKSKGDQSSSKSKKDKSKKSGKKSTGNGDKEPIEDPPATTSEPSGGKSDTDIQSWSEIPSIAHFCSLFRQAFDLLEFDIQELEESLLLMNTDADESQLVLRLLIKLLKGCSKTFTNNINEDNYNTYLRRLFLSKREELEEDNFSVCSNVNSFECKALLDDDIDFPDLSLRNRVRILQQLTEYRLDAEDVFEKVKNLEANSLRVDPLGKDSENVTYWYFYGTRLYKEEGRSEGMKSKKKDSKKKKKKEKKKKKKKKSARRESTTTEDDGEGCESSTQPKWSVACLTLQDWENLAAKYEKSKKRCDKELYETIHDSFLPEIVKMYAEKEREEKRKLLAMQPKRESSRIMRKRREQEHRDKELAEKLEEERRLEEEYDEKVREERLKREEEEREQARGERIKQRDAMKEMRAQRAAERLVRDTTDSGRRIQGAGRHSHGTSSASSSKAQSEDEDADKDEEDEDEEEGEDEYVPLNKKHRSSSGSSKKANSSSKKRRKTQKDRLFGDDNLYNPFHTGDDHESDEDYAPSRDEMVSATKENNRDKERDNGSSVRETKKEVGALHFTNALIKVGSKSFKDPGVEKPVRKTAGLLLETAGKSLLQRRMPPCSTAADRKFNSLLTNNLSPHGLSGKPAQLSFGLAPEKISFGLYDGNLAVESASSADDEAAATGPTSNSSVKTEVTSPLSNTKVKPETARLSSSSTGTELKTENGGSDPSGSTKLKSPISTSTAASSAPSTANTKRVFSNWGGAFFKKNLDHRAATANTNQILEKLKMHGASSSTNGGAGDGFRSAFSSGSGSSSGASPVKRPFEVMSKLASPTGGNSSGSDTAGSPTVKKFRPAGFSFGASFGSPPPQPPPSSANNT